MKNCITILVKSNFHSISQVEKWIKKELKILGIYCYIMLYNAIFSVNAEIKFLGERQVNKQIHSGRKKTVEVIFIISSCHRKYKFVFVKAP